MFRDTNLDFSCVWRAGSIWLGGPSAAVSVAERHDGLARAAGGLPGSTGPEWSFLMVVGTVLVLVRWCSVGSAR